jgi:hypothetical protein
MNTMQRYPLLVIALILLHLAGFSQEKKYVKKNLTWVPNKGIDSTYTVNPARNPPAKSFPDKMMAKMPSGFFCVQEYKLEKWTRLPIKIRLGSYEVAHRQEYGW